MADAACVKLWVLVEVVLDPQAGLFALVASAGLCLSPEGTFSMHGTTLTPDALSSYCLRVHVLYLVPSQCCLPGFGFELSAAVVIVAGQRAPQCSSRRPQSFSSRQPQHSFQQRLLHSLRPHQRSTQHLLQQLPQSQHSPHGLHQNTSPRQYQSLQSYPCRRLSRPLRCQPCSNRAEGSPFTAIRSTLQRLTAPALQCPASAQLRPTSCLAQIPSGGLVSS